MAASMFGRRVSVKIPGIAMLELTSDVVHNLNQHLKRKQEEHEARGEEEDAHECLELRFDLSITQKAIDPQRWAEDKAAHGRPISAADNGSLHSRLVALFNLGSIPKSRYVLADAIVLHKNSQAQGANGEEGMLELVRMISEERLPATFFELDGEEGRENTRTETA